MTKLTTPDFWDKAYVNVDFKVLPKDNPIRSWIETYIPQTAEQKTALEIGCYPGRYLEIMGALGYTLNGLDFNPNLKNLSSWLESQGHQVGSLEQVDFFEYNPEERFDMVCSFGFIEHFSNWDDVLKAHMKLVKQGGYLVVEVPNFRGLIQYLLHRFLDHENLKSHYLPSMNPRKWKRLAKEAGFEIEFCGYIGTYLFWHNNDTPNKYQHKIIKLLRKKQESIQKLVPGRNPFTSPYIGIIAKKR
jgi:2-polyprenyl-3-methyl-5-hydroxy-6-metoxy-1,4-benzoquinol methylase